MIKLFHLNSIQIILLFCSGVEDCCGEPPPPPAPSIDLDDKNGQRVGVRMIKPDGGGYGKKCLRKILNMHDLK